MSVREDLLPGAGGGGAEGEDDVAAAVADTDLGSYVGALRRGQVTFHDVAGAWFHLCEPRLDGERRARFEALFPDLLEAFAKPRGGVISSYFCRNLRVAAALTDIQRAAELPESVPQATSAAHAHAGAASSLNGSGGGTGSANGDGTWHRLRESPVLRPTRPLSASSSAIHLEPTFGHPQDWRAKQILFACLDLHYRSLEFLTPQPRKICMRLVFGVITALLGSLDSRNAPGRRQESGGDEQAELESLERELARAERYYSRSAQRIAQLEYFVGMVGIGLPVLAVLTAVIALVTRVDPLSEPLLVALVAGGAGAVVSVMNRMTSGRLILVAESGKAVIRLLGAIRPLIGAVFGVAVYVLLASELVSFAQVPAEPGRVLFAAGLGFIAGFSERFAQDMVAGAAGGLTSAPANAAVQPEASTSGRARSPGAWS